MRPPSRTPPELEPHMPKHIVSLDDKYALDESRQLLTGTQAVVRLMLTQRARDVKAGLNTAGLRDGLPRLADCLAGSGDAACKGHPRAQPHQVHGRPERGPRGYRPVGLAAG